MPRILILVLAAIAAVAVDPAAPATAALLGRALLPNGDFTAGWQGWAPAEGDKKAGKVQLASEDGNTFLRLAQPTQVLRSSRIVIDPAWKTLHVRCRMRVEGLQANEAISYGNARLANSFVMPDGKRRYLGIVQTAKDTGGWKELAAEAAIPEGAKEFEVACGNFGKAGQCDFDDIVVTAE